MGKLGEAQELLKELHSVRLKPCAVGYNTFIEVHLRVQDVKGVLYLLDEMRNHDLALDLDGYMMRNLSRS